MLNTKQDVAKNSALSEFFKNHWLLAQLSLQASVNGDGASFFLSGAAE